MSDTLATYSDGVVKSVPDLYTPVLQTSARLLARAAPLREFGRAAAEAHGRARGSGGLREAARRTDEGEGSVAANGPAGANPYSFRDSPKARVTIYDRKWKP